MIDMTVPPQRRPALIPKDAKLAPEDIWSIFKRTGYAMVPPPEPSSPKQAQNSRNDLVQTAPDDSKRGTKRKASTTNDRTYDST